MDDVTTDLVVTGGNSGRQHRTVLRLAWSRRDPLAVVLIVAAEPDHPALPRGQWHVLRDVIRAGLDGPAGEGAVRVRPSTADGKVALELDHEGHTCIVRVPITSVRDFLDATEEIVATGAEQVAADDAVIARLLSS